MLSPAAFKRSVENNRLRKKILEAVEQLRVRKARPDREAIAHYVMKSGQLLNDILAELECIVDDGGLFKVEYKGHVSYRSPRTFDSNQSPLLTKHSIILNSSKTTRLINTAMNELLDNNKSYSQQGIPLCELKITLESYDNVRFEHKKQQELLEKEVNSGNIKLVKIPDDHRVFPKDIEIPESVMKKAEESQDKEDIELNGVRSTPQRKGKKKTSKRNNKTIQTTRYQNSQDSIESASSSVIVSRVLREGADEDCSDHEQDYSPLKKRRKSSVGNKKNTKKEFENISNDASGIKNITSQRCKTTNESVPPSDRNDVSDESDGSAYEEKCGNDGRADVSDEKFCFALANADEDKISGEESSNSIETDQNKASRNSSGSQCLRSRRNKRKKQVFDPSDSQTYHTFSNNQAKSRKKTQSGKQEKKHDGSKVSNEGNKQVSKIQVSPITYPVGSKSGKSLSLKKGLRSQETEVENVKRKVSFESVITTEHDAAEKIATKDGMQSFKRSVSLSKVSQWTPIDVENFFVRHGMKDEGAVFRKEEIDGISLFLIDRDVVTQEMNMKLGPALKVFRLISQLRSNEITDV